MSVAPRFGTAPVPGRRRTMRLLIVEPRQLFARTVALVARDLQIADVVDANSYVTAAALLSRGGFDALLLGLHDEKDGLQLLQELRLGRIGPRSDLPVGVMTDAVDGAAVARLSSLSVQRVLLRPFKVKSAVDTIEHLCRPG